VNIPKMKDVDETSSVDRMMYFSEKQSYMRWPKEIQRVNCVIKTAVKYQN